jgi:hypothetical protein
MAVSTSRGSRPMLFRYRYDFVKALPSAEAARLRLVEHDPFRKPLHTFGIML